MIEMETQASLTAFGYPPCGVTAVIIEQTPAQLASDIADRGVTLVGGSTLLPGFPELVRDETGHQRRGKLSRIERRGHRGPAKASSAARVAAPAAMQKAGQQH